MADADTARLCTEIVRSVFGPLAAVSVWLFFGEPKSLTVQNPDCRISSIHLWPTWALTTSPILKTETADRPRLHPGPRTT